MSGVREWASVICMAALAASLLQYLLPGGSMERVARMVLGAFVICSVLIPLQKTLPQLSPDLSQAASGVRQNEEFRDTVDAQVQEAARGGIETIVRGELYKLGAECENVAVMMDTNEDGSISIIKVVVNLGRADAGRAGEVKAVLEKVLGLETEVAADGGA